MGDLQNLAAGIILGLSVAAPVGPSALLLIQRTVASGIGPGIATGLGFATVHLSYGAFAGMGLALLSAWYTRHTFEMQIIGAAFLLWFGLRASAAGRAERRPASYNGLAGPYGTGVLFTAANPITPLLFAFVAPGLIKADPSVGAVAGLAAGVFLGSAGWWLGLAAAVSFTRRQVNPRTLSGLQRTSSGALVALGSVLLAATLVGAHTDRAAKASSIADAAAAEPLPRR